MLVEEISLFFLCQALHGLIVKETESRWRTYDGGIGEKGNLWKKNENSRENRLAGPSGGEDSHEILSVISTQNNTTKRRKEKGKINRLSLKRNILPAMKANLGGIQEGNNAAGSLVVHYLSLLRF